MAGAEKALLDLIHLEAGADKPEYLNELRLQNLEALDLAELRRQAKAARSPKLERATAIVGEIARVEAEDYVVL